MSGARIRNLGIENFFARIEVSKLENNDKYILELPIAIGPSAKVISREEFFLYTKFQLKKLSELAKQIAEQY